MRESGARSRKGSRSFDAKKRVESYEDKTTMRGARWQDKLQRKAADDRGHAAAAANDNTADRKRSENEEKTTMRAQEAAQNV